MMKLKIIKKIYKRIEEEIKKKNDQIKKTLYITNYN